MKKLKDTFDYRPTRPTRHTKHFEAKKVDKSYGFLKPNIPLLTQNSINGKSLNWTPTGYASHLPLGEKHFEAKKVDKSFRFLKSNIPFLTQNSINGQSLN